MIKMFTLVLDLLKVCLSVKLESSVLQDLLPSSIDQELDLIDQSSCRLFFNRIFQLSLSSFDV